MFIVGTKRNTYIHYVGAMSSYWTLNQVVYIITTVPRRVKKSKMLAQICLTQTRNLPTGLRAHIRIRPSGNDRLSEEFSCFYCGKYPVRTQTGLLFVVFHSPSGYMPSTTNSFHVLPTSFILPSDAHDLCC